MRYIMVRVFYGLQVDRQCAKNNLLKIFGENIPILGWDRITTYRIRFRRTILVSLVLGDICSDYPLSIDFSHISFVICGNGAILIRKIQGAHVLIFCEINDIFGLISK